MTQKREEEEEDLWQRVVRGVRENLQRNRGEQEGKQGARPRQNIGEEIEEAVEQEPKQRETKKARGGVSPSVVGEAEKQLRGKKSRGGSGLGLDRRSARRLRRGEMLVEERIDLHGLLRGEAREVLRMRLRSCYERGLRCVLVISGKGKGIVREEVMLVLESVEIRDIVVKHDEAQLRDGGAGARYVLLRRKRG